MLEPLSSQAEEEAAGGKARNLSKLLALGLPVPPGLVLTRAAFDCMLDYDGLRARIAEAEREAGGRRAEGDASAALARSADAVRELLARAPWPPEVEGCIRQAAREALPGPLAVRSSAVGEDGAAASFAGQFDSVLDVGSLAALEAAIRRCWASHWSARAQFYRTTRRATPLGMALVIQKQVDAAVAGVLFTVAPAAAGGNGARAHMVIESCSGLAEGLVSGRTEPDRLVIDRSTGEVVSEVVAGQDPHRAARACLKERLAELVQYAEAIEEGFGCPQDIEWAIDRSGRVWIVQSRPITTLPASTRQPDAGVSWSNANVSENFPGPISPFLYSIAAVGYYHYFRNLGLAFGVSKRRLAAMDRPLGTIIGVHGARMYYNLSNIHAVLRLAPFGDALAAAFNRFVGTAGRAPSPRGVVDWSSRRGRVSQAIEVVRIAACTAWQYALLRRRIETFERTADEYAARTRPEALADRPLQDLGDDLAAFLDIRFHRWKNASLADAAAMVCYALLERSLRGLGDDDVLHNRLLRALPGVPSSQPPLRLWALSRLIREHPALRSLFATGSASEILAAIRADPRFHAFSLEFGRFLDDWGFRSSEELMLTVPSLQERPEPAIELLRQYAASDGEPPQDAIARQAASRVADTARLLKSLRFRAPLRALWIRLVLAATQRAICYRERARLKQALLYTRCRRVALAIGDRLARAGKVASRDDVFMLTWREVTELIDGSAMFPYSTLQLVDLRRHAHARLAAMRPPDAVRLDEGEYLPIEQPPQPAGELWPEAGSGTALVGTSACSGRTTARAAVLADVAEARKLARGDVLVTRQTDPGWGPVFCLISGLVIERGGMLSHGAILAREFGLPCVVGVKDATRLIPHGATITVDGDRGACHLAAPAAEGEAPLQGGGA